MGKRTAGKLNGKKKSKSKTEECKMEAKAKYEPDSECNAILLGQKVRKM